ncbi:MAG: baseplate J/gp47 family protein [Novosphingobium sp.]
MPFQRPTLNEIIERTFSDITSRLSLKGALLRRSVVGVLARVLAGASHMLHGHLDWIAKQAIPDTADEWLPRWAGILGISRKAAEFADGEASFVGTTDGTIIPAGTVLRRSDDIEYETTADATLSAGTATVPVAALVAGSIGNADAGTVLTIVNPIANVNSDATVAAGGITNGADVEGNDSLRARMLARIQQPPHGGADFDYETWALEVAGVTRAWVYPLHMGAGTVGITFVRDADTPIIPDANEVQAVQDYIDARRPVTAEAIVFAPVADTLDFTIQVTPATAAVKAAIEAELIDFIGREAEPGGTLYLSRINEAISIAAGEFDHVLLSPADDVVYATGHLAVMGVITWA